jgi:hypothetical protein
MRANSIGLRVRVGMRVTVADAMCIILCGDGTMQLWSMVEYNGVV